MAKQSSLRNTILCWCGSGQKYSKCHRDRDEQIPLKSHELDAEFRKAFAKEYCLHPQSSSSTCSQQIVKAHSVSVSSNLKNIAEDGHILRFSFPPKTPVQARMRVTAQLIGVKKASIFTGFCKLHDSQTFARIDQPIALLTHEHYFLLAYRALCQVFFTKAASFAASPTLRQLDRGTPRHVQHAHQESCFDREFSLLVGLDDLHRDKAEFDRQLLSRNFEAISYYALELDHAPQIVCSVGFTPEVNFKGNQLQSIESPEIHADMCTCSIISTKRGGAFVFAWLKETNGASVRLIESLDGLKPYLIPSAIVRLVFECGENVFFSKSWWNDLDPKTQMMLEDRANSVTDKPPKTLLDDGCRPVLWSIVSKSMSPNIRIGISRRSLTRS
jgi:hypothetical protein